MKTFLQLVRECDPVKLLGYLTEDQPPALFERHLKVYEKLYAHFIMQHADTCRFDVVLAGLSPERSILDNEVYNFYGIIDPDVKKSIVEQLYFLDDLDLVKNLWIPEKLIEQTSELHVVGEVFRHLFARGERMELVVDASLQTWSNEVRNQYSENAYLIRRYENKAMRRKWNQQFYDSYLRKMIVNEVQEYCERKYATYDLGDLIYCGDEWYLSYTTMCVLFPLEYAGGYNILRELKSTYGNAGLDTYKEVQEYRERILIEPSAAPNDKHLVYVKNYKGETFPLNEVDQDRLICMEVRILDPRGMSTAKALALLLYHMQYALRAEREHRVHLVNRLLQLSAAKVKEKTTEEVSE